MTDQTSNMRRLMDFATNGMAAQAAADAIVAEHTPPATDRPHIRIRYATLGVHTHCSVWSVERGGPDVAHGRNGTLVFRNAEFDALRSLIEIGAAALEQMMGRSAAVEFVEDPEQAGITAGSVTRALYETEGSE